jgi:hypothetical protein
LITNKEPKWGATSSPHIISAHHHFTESIPNIKGNLVLVLFTLLVLFLSWYRLRFGVDFTDEAFCIAVPYRFALGDRLFIDEISLAPFAIFTTPFIKLHLWLQGDLDGVVLSMRQLYLCFTCLVGITYYKHPFYCCLLLIVLPVSFMPWRSFSPTTNMMFINHYSLLAPLIAMLTWQNKPVRQLFLLGWLPAFFMGLTTAWSSGNGFRNASIGWLAGAIVTVVLITLALTELTELEQREKTARRFGLRYLQSIPALMFVLFLLQSQFRSGAVYRDDNIPLLTSRVTSGPYQGIYTTPLKHGYLQAITRDINSVVGNKPFYSTICFLPVIYEKRSECPAACGGDE